MRKVLLCAILLLSASLPSHAQFVRTDWKVEGDSAALLDTTTGVEWLHFRYTDGMSVNQVLGLTETTFQGWRLPTIEEVTTLLNNFFPVVFEMGQPKSVSPTGPEGKLFGAWFGETKDFGTDAFSRGMLIGANGTATYSGVWFNKNPQYNSYSLSYLSNSYSLDYRHDNLAVFLVSDGGATLSSINDPMLNINNPAAPINSEPAESNTPEVSDVPVLSFGSMLLAFFGLRRFSQQQKA